MASANTSSPIWPFGLAIARIAAQPFVRMAVLCRDARQMCPRHCCGSTDISVDTAFVGVKA